MIMIELCILEILKKLIIVETSAILQFLKSLKNFLTIEKCQLISLRWSKRPIGRSRRSLVKLFPLKHESHLSHDEDLVGEIDRIMRPMKRMNDNMRKNVVEESKIPIDWESSESSSSSVVPVMHSKMCFDGRDPLEEGRQTIIFSFIS